MNIDSYLLNIFPEDIEAFRKPCKEAVKSRYRWIVQCSYCQPQGKQLRPKFVQETGGNINDSTLRAARWLSCRTQQHFVHDDTGRRSHRTRISLLLLLSPWKTIAAYLGWRPSVIERLVTSETMTLRVLVPFRSVVKMMRRGNGFKLRKHATQSGKKIYYEIIKKVKWRSLLSFCLWCRCLYNFQRPGKIEKLKLFGKIRHGIQIKDDLFDLWTENIGKPTGNDIKEKKLTLPLIYTLEQLWCWYEAKITKHH